jgi:diguanylate cyclase (GGDEF)-like protein/PAS domain S-box-containing protein
MINLMPTQPLSAHEMQQVMDFGMGATISVIDLELRFRYVNTGFAKAFNLTPEAMFGMSVLDAYGAVHHAAFMPYVNRALAGEPVNYERLGRMQATLGLWRTVSMSPWRNEANEIIGVVTASLPVHELKTSTEALRVANDRLSSHMDNSPLAVLELDAQLVVTHGSSRVLHMLGLDPHTLAGQPLLAALGGSENLQALQALQTAFARLQAGAESRNRVASAHQRPDGSVLHCQWFNSALVDAAGQVSSIMALVEDVSARVQAEAQLRHLALHDQLTGLPNRSALAERLTDALIRSNRSHTPVALLFIDLDGFKRVNDNFGHASGDEVLKEVSHRLCEAVRATDVVARIGGDEFVVLLDTEVHEDTPERVCERIFESLKPLCTFAIGQAQIGASIGVAKHPPLPDQADDLLKRADAAMYEAKHAGKGCVRYAMM